MTIFNVFQDTEVINNWNY